MKACFRRVVKYCKKAFCCACGRCQDGYSTLQGSSGYHGLRTTSSDWSDNAANGTHYWYEYEGGAMCNLTTPDKDCGSVGYRRTKVKCAACRMVLHEECQENLSVKCRSTFR